MSSQKQEKCWCGVQYDQLAAEKQEDDVITLDDDEKEKVRIDGLRVVKALIDFLVFLCAQEEMATGSESSESSLEMKENKFDDVSGDVTSDVSDGTSSSAPPQYDDVVVHANEAFEDECDVTKL